MQDLSVDLNFHIFLYFLFSGLVIGFTVMTLIQRKIHDLVLLAGFFYLSCVGYRNIPLFILATVPLLAESIRQLAWLKKIWASLDKLISQRTVPVMAGVLLVLLGLRIITGAYYYSDRRPKHFGLGLDDNQIPVQAVQFLAQNHLDGRILNDMGLSDWLVWQGPQPVFIDGRQQVMGESFYREYLETFHPGGLERAIAQYHPQLIACQYNDAVPWAVQMFSMPNWRLIYADTLTTIYASNDYALQFPPLSFSRVADQYHIRLTQADIEKAAENIKPTPKLLYWIKGFYEPRKYPFYLQNLGLLALHYKDYDSSQDFFAESLCEAGGNYFEIFYNLGLASLNQKQYHLGKILPSKSPSAQT